MNVAIRTGSQSISRRAFATGRARPTKAIYNISRFRVATNDAASDTDKYRLCENNFALYRLAFAFRSISNGLMTLLTAVLFNVDLCIGVSAD